MIKILTINYTFISHLILTIVILNEYFNVFRVKKVPFKGVTLKGEKAEPEIWVCGPGAFIVLKILAFHQRVQNIDAYDLYIGIRNYGIGIDEVCECLSPLLKEAETKKALEILSRDFVDPDSLGPRRQNGYPKKF